MTTRLVSFHNDPKIKIKYLRRIVAHQKADEIVKGLYWEEGKGCAVGCTIHGNNHAQYEIELGLPEWLARLEDSIFEGLPNARAKRFPKEFLQSIDVGADVSKVKHQFLHWLLMDKKYGVIAKFDHKVFPDVKNAIVQVAELHAQCITGKPWNESAARSAAWSAELAARSAVRSAVRSAAWSAAWSAVRSAAWSAVRSAARSAELAARSAVRSAVRSAAWSAAWSAVRSAAWSAVRSAARSAVRSAQADKLLELLRACKKKGAAQ